MKRTASFRAVAASVILGLVFGAGGTMVGLKAAGVSFVRGTNSPEFQKFFTAYHDLHTKYVTKQSESTLLNGAIDGMTKSIGDPFTDYFNPTSAKQFQDMLSSSFVGIGVEIEQSDTGIEIMSVFDGSPAAKAGIKPHDIITAVNGTDVTQKSMEEVQQLVVGPAGSAVKVTVRRPGQPDPLTFTMKRAKIEKPSVTTKMLPNHVGYMDISVVAQDTATEVTKDLASLQKQGAKSLILDVRGNPGGYLQVAINIASQFVPKGKVVVETQDRQGHVFKDLSKGPGSKLPVVVLMDDNTASAAEILSAALHDDNGVPLVGTQSFGKGTVQITQGFSDGSSLKFTVDKWLTPTGAWINKKGLTPTDPVKLPSYVTLPTISSLKLPLEANQNSNQVATLQKTLQALGQQVDRTDGYYDASTKAAIQSLQQQAGLSQTGTVDKQTAAAIDKEFQKLLANSDTQLKEAEQLATSIQSGQQD